MPVPRATLRALSMEQRSVRLVLATAQHTLTRTAAPPRPLQCSEILLVMPRDMCERLLQAPTLAQHAHGRRESAGHHPRRLRKTEDALAPVTEASEPSLQPAAEPQQPANPPHMPWPGRQRHSTSTARARAVIV